MRVEVGRECMQARRVCQLKCSAGFLLAVGLRRITTTHARCIERA